jgi:hypothetical protein
MPVKDAEFIAWAKTIYRDCSENAPTWQLDPNLLNQFHDLVSAANSAYENNADKELRNRATVSIKDAAFATLKLFLSTYVNTLEGNTNIPDEAITSMGLRPRHPHAHQLIPVPTDAPVSTAVVGQHHDVTAYASTLQHGYPTEFLKDGKYAGFVLKYLVDGETPWQTVVSTQEFKTVPGAKKYGNLSIKAPCKDARPCVPTAENYTNHRSDNQQL